MQSAKGDGEQRRPSALRVGTLTLCGIAEPSDTFYMMYDGGDRGEGCETSPRTADVYIHCQGCPSYLEQKNEACGLDSAPCVCAAYEEGCIGEVHMVVQCPAGIPNYRKGFDVYDASTGIEEDISKVVVKDGEVMPGWTDEDSPSVAHDRAVIPGDVQSAVFYLMMADEDLQVLRFDRHDHDQHR
jgi:hypothetical protein